MLRGGRTGGIEPHSIPPFCYRGEQVTQGDEKGARNERKGGRDKIERENDFQRDNEPLNDG